MSHRIRATALGFLSLLFCIPQVIAKDADPGRIAIIDSADNVKKHLQKLHDAGVRVIGRYYSRCAQTKLVPEKRIIDNKGEADAIFSDKYGFAMLSIYQFYSAGKHKLSGQLQKTYTAKDGPEKSKECKIAPGEPSKTITISLPDQNCKWRTIRNCEEVDGSQHSTADEARWDAKAAGDQAKSIGQPAGSAIYFGVDFNYESDTEANILEYFTVINQVLSSPEYGYKVGAYGNGSALQLLRSTIQKDGSGKPLAEFAWFNASPGHSGTTEVFNEGNWHLIQTRVATRFPQDVDGALIVDIDVQNKKFAEADIGFWNRKGSYRVPAERTHAIFDQRRFVCDGLARIQKLSGSGDPMVYCARRRDGGSRRKDCDEGIDSKTKEPFPTDLTSRLCYADVTRVGERQGDYITIDCDEDGKFEAKTLVTNLGATFDKRPKWINIPTFEKREQRREIKISNTTCVQHAE